MGGIVWRSGGLGWLDIMGWLALSHDMTLLIDRR
jgi:hypothetical protein